MLNKAFVQYCVKSYKNMENTEVIPIANCTCCKYYLNALLYQLCTHTNSEYTASNHKNHHTIQHMRIKGACGSNASLYTPK